MPTLKRIPTQNINGKNHPQKELPAAILGYHLRFYLLKVILSSNTSILLGVQWPFQLGPLYRIYSGGYPGTGNIGGSRARVVDGVIYWFGYRNQSGSEDRTGPHPDRPENSVAHITGTRCPSGFLRTGLWPKKLVAAQFIHEIRLSGETAEVIWKIWGRLYQAVPPIFRISFSINTD